MNQLLRHSLWMVLTVFMFSSCVKKYQELPSVSEGWVPVYSDPDDVHRIQSLSPRGTENPGKIYIHGNFLFQVESNRGIHIFEFEEKKPQRISFIEIRGAQEISIRGHILYSNNLNDLVGIDISDIFDAKPVSRIKDAFNVVSQDVPPGTGRQYFVCPDPSRGIIVGWDLAEDVRADCQSSTF